MQRSFHTGSQRAALIKNSVYTFDVHIYTFKSILFEGQAVISSKKSKFFGKNEPQSFNYRHWTVPIRAYFVEIEALVQEIFTLTLNEIFHTLQNETARIYASEWWRTVANHVFYISRADRSLSDQFSAFRGLSGGRGRVVCPCWKVKRLQKKNCSHCNLCVFRLYFW